MKLELWRPVKPFQVFQGYGAENTDPRMVEKYKALGLKGHNGFDIFAPHGTPVRAAHKGEVVVAGLDGSNGTIVVLKTLDKFDYKDTQVYFKTLYGHLVKEVSVLVGDTIEVGQVIGFADNTGFSTGDHLHFGLKPVEVGEEDWKWWNIEQDNGYNGAIDPTPYINEFYAEDYHLVMNNLNEQFSILTEIVKLLKSMLLWKK